MASPIAPHVIHDIETVENVRAAKYYTQVKKYFPRSNLKDAAKIEADIREKRQKDLDKAALQWWSGKVICICADVIGIPKAHPVAFVGDDEKELLCLYFDWLTDLFHKRSDLRVVGKNGDTFDRPFLIGRALVHDIGIPQVFRPYRPVDDVDQIFGFSASRCAQIGKLDEYGFGLDIEMKTMHGSMVGDLYNETKMGDPSKWQEIATYCGHDVHITKEIFSRWLKDYELRTPKPTAEETALPETDIPFG